MDGENRPPSGRQPHDHEDHEHGPESGAGISRRLFVRTTAAGIAASALAGSDLANTAWAADRERQAAPGGVGRGRGRRYVLKGGIVLSLDPKVGDFVQGDVLVEDSRILAVGPNLHAFGEVIDCRGLIVMPGFISTHNHQYEAIQRSIIADGLIVFAGDPDQQPTSTEKNVYEAYTSIVQNVWTAGRIGPATNPQWDIGRSPYDPEDNYNAELIACLSQITQGITCGTDTSQASHTPEHTDAMIQACFDSGRRSVFDYTNGTNRDTNPPPAYKVPYGVPTSPNEYPLKGLQRISQKWFSSKDQLVTLGFAGGPTVIPDLPPPYTGMTGWALGRAFGAYINNHNVGAATVPAQALAAGLAPFDDVTLVHCVRWQDYPVAQISHSDIGYPNPATSTSWKIWADNGGHVSIAGLIEAQMRHGMPPFQMALNHGILPSLSPDVDTNMTPDPFSMMRGAFVLQRGLANDLTFPISDPGGLPTPQLVTSQQVVEMMTVAGAAGSGLLKKVGTLTPGKEADIVFLDWDNLNIQPMNNVYGSIVTMMDTRHVRHVMIGGRFVYWNGRLLGWDVDQIVRRAVRSRDRVLARINGTAAGSDPDIIHRGMNSFGHPYRPAFLTSCCYKGQNEVAPHYVLRP
jgi:cytosine/adenosine deaminase-related metal-dependent hydrolase